MQTQKTKKLASKPAPVAAPAPVVAPVAAPKSAAPVAATNGLLKRPAGFVKPQPSPLTLSAKPTAPGATPVTATPVAAPVGYVSKAELEKAIAKATEGLIARLDAVTAKLKAKNENPKNARTTVETILEGSPEALLKKDDWRAAFHGRYAMCRGFTVSAKGEITILPDAELVLTFCAIPRDSDPGGQGTAARAAGNIALWSFATEARDAEGYAVEYVGIPDYMSRAETDQLFVFADDPAE